VTKSILDMHTQLNFLSPKILNMSEYQFANQFMIYKNKKEWGTRPWRRWSKPYNEKALVEIIRPYIFDCELNINVAKKESNKYLGLTREEEREYQDYKNEVVSLLEQSMQMGEEISFFHVAQKYQQFYCCCENKIAQLQEEVAAIKTRKEKVIIYVKFVKELGLLKNALGEKDVELYSGQHKVNLEAFAGDKSVLICTYGVGSLGLNLQFCNNMIFFTPTFDYKLYEQAKYRIYRMGQNKDVNIIEYYADTKLDEIIRGCLARKESLLNRMNKYISKKEALAL
jgi:SNF2 family DNA or RNA helicase